MPRCPQIGDEDFAALSQSIKDNGLRHEIVLTKEGLLIDGSHRLIACYDGRVEPRFKKVSTDPWQVAYAENIARRHLSVYAKCEFAMRGGRMKKRRRGRDSRS